VQTMLIDEKHESSFRIYFSVVDQLITFLRSLSTNVNDTPTERKETGGEKGVLKNIQKNLWIKPTLFMSSLFLQKRIFFHQQIENGFNA